MWWTFYVDREDHETLTSWTVYTDRENHGKMTYESFYYVDRENHEKVTPFMLSGKMMKKKLHVPFTLTGKIMETDVMHLLR